MAMSMPPPEPSAAFAPAPVPAPETEAVSSEAKSRRKRIIFLVGGAVFVSLCCLLLFVSGFVFLCFVFGLFGCVLSCWLLVMFDYFVQSLGSKPVSWWTSDSRSSSAGSHDRAAMDAGPGPGGLRWGGSCRAPAAAGPAPRTRPIGHALQLQGQSDGGWTHPTCSEPESQWFLHEPITIQAYQHMKEICAGMGGIGMDAHRAP